MWHQWVSLYLKVKWYTMVKVKWYPMVKVKWYPMIKVKWCPMVKVKWYPMIKVKWYSMVIMQPQIYRSSLNGYHLMNSIRHSPHNLPRHTCISSKLMATTRVKSQLVRPARDMARGRGPWRNSSAAIIMGMGPGGYKLQCYWFCFLSWGEVQKSFPFSPLFF